MRKGTKMSLESRQLMSEAHKGKKFSLFTRKRMSLTRVGRKASFQTIEKMRRNQVGEGNNNWKEDTNNYSTIHKWLTRTFGKAISCESNSCKKNSNSYQWALLKGKKYQRRRENFWMLCRSCHSSYDDIVKNIAINI